MTPGLFLALAAGGLVAGLLFGPKNPRLWLVVTLVAGVAALAAAVDVLAGGMEWEWQSEYALAGAPLHLRLDCLSAWFVALLALIGGSGAAYAHQYWNDREKPQSAPRGRRWWCALVLSMGFVMLCSNGLHFLIGWELFAVSAYFLITLDRQRRQVRAAGWLYLAASHAGTLCLFAFFTVLAIRTGSWELGPMREHRELAPLFWLMHK